MGVCACAAATIPALIGATSHVRADVTLTDHAGRTAYLFGAFQYDPGARPYVETLVIFVALVLCSCVVMPTLVRAGCKGSVVLREKLVWRQIDPRALEPAGKGAPEAYAARRPVVVEAAVGAVKSVFRAVGLGEKAEKPPAAPAPRAVGGAAPEMV